MEPVYEPGWTSLLPAVVAIVLAFATRQVVVALFAGVITGGLVLFVQTAALADLNLIDRFLFPALGTKGFARILLIYLWCLGGLIGLWTKTGAALHFAETAARWVRGSRSALGVSWLLGCVFHQGGTVSTVLTATTVRPIADRHRVSHEELSYVVDSTASPVATILAFNAWPFYVAGLVAGTIEWIPDADAGVAWFWSSIWFNFYAWLAVLSTLAFSLGVLPWVGGRMGRARERARSTGELDGPDAEPLVGDTQLTQPALGYTPSLWDFGVPLAVLLGVAVVPYLVARENWIDIAFGSSVLSAMLLARVRGMSTTDVIGGFVDGCRGMTIGAIILALAVTLGTVSRELATAAYLVDVVGDAISPVVLPAMLMLLCMGIAFATGSSWGTYAVVFPVALPLAYAISPDPLFVKICFGAVLGGAVYGDQCSPISDTTILSSMFTGCDLMDHVRTQLPLASVAAGLGALLSTLAVVLAG